jgi:hypothetical protein
MQPNLAKGSYGWFPLQLHHKIKKKKPCWWDILTDIPSQGSWAIVKGHANPKVPLLFVREIFTFTPNKLRNFWKFLCFLFMFCFHAWSVTQGCCYAFGNGTLIFKSYPSPSLIFVHEDQSGYPHMSHLHFQLEVGNSVRWVLWLRKYPSILGIPNFS